MSKQWPMFKLGSILKLQRRWITLDPMREYGEIGIRSHGRGIFHKPLVSGASLGDKRVLRICPGDLVFMNVFAWEGAVAVAGPSENGKIGSHRFATYTPVDDAIDPRFLQLYFRTKAGRELLGRVSPGSAGRNRTMNLTALAEQSVPVPPLTEQRRIVARIETLAAKIGDARRLRESATKDARLLSESAKRSIFPAPCGTTVGNFVAIQSGHAFKSEWFTEDGIRLVRNVNIGHGKIEWSQIARIPSERRAEFARFDLQVNDILITLDRPIISTGVKVARVCLADVPSLLLQRVGRVQFKYGSVLPNYLFEWLRSPHFVDAIDPGRSNGVPHISPKDVERAPFSAPSIAEQQRIVSYLNALSEKEEIFDQQQDSIARELDALLPAILDRSFKGEL